MTLFNIFTPTSTGKQGTTAPIAAAPCGWSEGVGDGAVPFRVDGDGDAAGGGCAAIAACAGAGEESTLPGGDLIARHGDVLHDHFAHLGA